MNLYSALEHFFAPENFLEHFLGPRELADIGITERTIWFMCVHMSHYFALRLHSALALCAYALRWRARVHQS